MIDDRDSQGSDNYDLYCKICKIVLVVILIILYIFFIQPFICLMKLVAKGSRLKPSDVFSPTDFIRMFIGF